MKNNPQITPVKYASLVLQNLTGQAQIMKNNFEFWVLGFE